MVYEALIVAAILLAAGLLYSLAAGGIVEGGLRLAFQAYLVAVLGLYFVWCWRRGRTLAMRAWHLRVVREDGRPLSTGQAALRFVLAALTLGTGSLGLIAVWKAPYSWGAWAAVAAGLLTVAWAWFDRDGQFLHDRLARTRLVLVKEARKPRAAA